LREIALLQGFTFVEKQPSGISIELAVALKEAQRRRISTPNVPNPALKW
jgi:hypothetical protein